MADSVKALEAARDRLIQPTEAMSEAFALWDADDRLVLFNSKFGELFDGLVDHPVGKTCEELCILFHQHLLADDGRPPLEEWLVGRMNHHRKTLGPRETRLRDGRWMSTREFPTPDGGTVGIYTDITEAKERQRALEHGEQRMRAVMNSVIDGILTLADDGTVESANAAAAGIFGYAPAALIGLGIGKLLAHADPVSAARPVSRLAVTDFTSLPGQTLLEMVGLRGDGTSFPIELSLTSIDLHGRRTFIAAVRDITARKAAEEAALYHATHDALTDLPNRALFHDRLTTALRHAGAGRRHAGGAVPGSRSLQDDQRHLGAHDRRFAAGRGQPSAARQRARGRYRGAHGGRRVHLHPAWPAHAARMRSSRRRRSSPRSGRRFICKGTSCT